MEYNLRRWTEYLLQNRSVFELVGVVNYINEGPNYAFALEYEGCRLEFIINKLVAERYQVIVAGPPLFNLVFPHNLLKGDITAPINCLLTVRINSDSLEIIGAITGR